MILLPVGQVQHWLNFPRQLASVLERPDEFAPDVALCSLNVEESVLHETADLLDLHLSEEKIRSGRRRPTPPLRKAPFTYRTGLDVRHWLAFERSYGQATNLDVHLFKDSTTVRFTSPVQFRGPGAVLIRLSGVPFDALPERPSDGHYEGDDQLGCPLVHRAPPSRPPISELRPGFGARRPAVD